MIPSRTPSSTPGGAIDANGGEAGLFDNEGVLQGSMFDLRPGRVTGETWTLYFHCKGAPPENEFIHLEIDKGDISYYNLVCLKSRLGYAGRDYLYYKKRCGRDKARLELLDFDHQAETMVANSMEERKVRLVLTKEPPTELQVSISPIKRSREPPISCQPCTEDTLDEYKIWLAMRQEQCPDTDLKDDYRDATIKTYTEWLSEQGELPDIVSYLDENSNDIDERILSPTKRPSHARRQKQKGVPSQRHNKGGRGTLKGLVAANKRISNGSQKLEIEFSTKTGGPIGINQRSFVDEVAVFTRRRAPLIGVKNWKQIKQIVKNSIASDILSRWDFKDTMNAKKKIWAIANERYKGWRSTLSATNRAYGSYAERMKHKPEDLDIVEWHYLILYFNTEGFKVLSNTNSDSRKNKKTQHLSGSKPFSQISHEQRDPETGEEPTDLNLWMSTHMKNGQWSDAASKEVYDNACQLMCEKEAVSDCLILSNEELDNVFQSTYNETVGCKSSRLHGRGYLAKRPSPTERMRAEMDKQAHATAVTQQKNSELEDEVKKLKEQLANETVEREEMEERQNCAIEKLRAEMKALVAEKMESSTQQPNLSNEDSSDDQNRQTQGTDNNIVRSLFQNTKPNGSASYITSQQLTRLAKSRARS